jgi:uncharacterized membrane protein
MTGDLGWVALAGAFLLGSHFGISSTGLRARLIDRLGEKAYLGLYSIVALVALVLLVMAYESAPFVLLWTASIWMWFVPLLVMPFALLFLVGGLSAPNPTAVGQDALLEKELGPRGVLRITRNPVMWAIGLWGAAPLVPHRATAMATRRRCCSSARSPCWRCWALC